MPAEALAFVVRFENISEYNVHKINKIITDAGFHSAEVTGGDLLTSFNYQPFENTDKQIQLLITCVGRISDAIPNVEVKYEIKDSNDSSVFTQQRCEITVESENKVDTTFESTGDVNFLGTGILFRLVSGLCLSCISL
jgi:hypothetical protein